MEDKKEAVLKQLKSLRKTKNISYQDIVDGTEKIGEAVSMSTVKRVFSESSKASDFRYATTIRPIVRLVMGIDGDFEEPQTYEEARANSEALASVVNYKDSMISHLEQEVASVREASEKEKDYLRQELTLARSEKATLEKALRSFRVMTYTFMLLFIVCLLLVIAYLIVDKTHPEWGIFWTAAAASVVK